jgi:cytochrome c oxidase subunit II
MTARRPCHCWLIAATVIGGCGNHQSVLNPMGPEALRLAHLTWLLLGFGVVMLGIVVLAAVAALRGPDPLRAVLASARTVVWAGIFFPAVALTGLLGYGVWLTRASTAGPRDQGAVRIEVTGEQWWWRVHYPQLDGAPVATANEIRIPVGRPVLFELRSADVIHSFWVPNLGGKVDMIPGRTTFLRLQADRTGVFRGQCAEFCGGPHALMALEVLAVRPAEFDAWLQAQSKPANDPETVIPRRGMALFLEAGCGACHTVRGTAAAGMIGPDLTHLGSRRSVGVDTAAMNEAAIARFIRDGQHVKPGNRMPPFRIFAPDDLRAVASYLAGLR